MNKVRKNYINNADFMIALAEYKEKKKSNPETPIPNYIGECFIKIAEGLSYKPNFVNYPCREEMVSDAIENSLKYFSNFDPEISTNPFAYFTQITYYAFLRRIQQEKHQLYAKYKATEQKGIVDEAEFFDMDGGVSKQFELYGNISEFIENYEKTQQKRKDDKKLKVKPKGIENFLEE